MNSLQMHALNIAQEFELPAAAQRCEEYVGGHINRSYRVACEGQQTRYLLQRINHEVFPQPERIMANIARVSRHFRERHSDSKQQFLELIPTRSGQAFLSDPDGAIWRCYRFIEGAVMRESATSPEQAAQAGRAFGEFQVLLADLTGPRLHEIIVDFHHTPVRYATFDKKLAQDSHARAQSCQAEVDFVDSMRGRASQIVDGLETGALREQAVHNDAKLSNVLLHRETEQALCVVDLDTLMPGSPLYDFGDMMRTMICSAAEDERDLAQVKIDLDMFRALTAGYLATAREILSPAEIELMVEAGVIITLETGLRFFTDHLDGDQYFRTHRDAQNLDRARCQFELVRSIESQRSALEAIVLELL